MSAKVPLEAYLKIVGLGSSGHTDVSERHDSYLGEALTLELAKQGALSLGSPNDAASYPPLPPRLPSRVARDLLDEERGAR